jgi:hypothetical protein
MNLPNEHSSTPDEVNDILQPGFNKRMGDLVKGVNDEEIDALKLEEEMAKEALNRLVADNTARKKFSKWIFVLTVFWMFSVLTVVVLCGRTVLQLSNGVLIALITTTTANVFGFFYVVVNYLFNKSKST